jgi:hypothetical protein
MLTSKAFWASAGERAIKTFAQTAIALLGTTQLISVIDVDWAEVAGVSVLAGVLSILTSVALPAAETKSSVRAEADAKVAATKPATKKVTKKA